MKLEGDRFTLLPGSEGLGRLADLLPYRGQILVVTRFNGIYSYDGTGVRPYACAADPFMRGNPIFCAALDGALLALGSVQGGVCLLDLEKDAMNVVSIHNGLQNQTVLGLFFDARHDLWLGLDNGIDCLRLSSPVFSLYGDKPYIGSGYSSVLYKGSLYLGTNQGFFKTGFPRREKPARADGDAAGHRRAGVGHPGARRPAVLRFGQRHLRDRRWAGDPLGRHQGRAVHHSPASPQRRADSRSVWQEQRAAPAAEGERAVEGGGLAAWFPGVRQKLVGRPVGLHPVGRQ